MKKGRSTGAPTAAQAHRFALIKEIGCICCWIKGVPRVPADIHHLTIGGKHGQKRRGHDDTIGLCQWHHRGVLPYLGAQLAAGLGPSYALEPRKFREQFGTDDQLLEFQNQAIAIAEAA